MLPTRDKLCILLLFALAIGLRFSYQHASETEESFRADAGKYYAAAYNLRYHGAHSIDEPGEEAPATRTDLAPGYPLLLAAMLDRDRPREELLASVRNMQALMGGAVVVLTFLLARQSLGFSWAAFAAVLTALNPHLIALDDYLLTESFFIFVMMLGCTVFAVGWRRESLALLFTGALLVALSSQVRTVSVLLAPALALLLLIPRSFAEAPAGRARWRGLALVAVAWLLVWGAHRAFVDWAVMNAEAIQEEPTEFAVYKSPGTYLADAVTPPKWALMGQSHILAKHGDGTWKQQAEVPFTHQPIAYAKWVLGGKLLTLWSFDMAYNGDVYVYPMIRKGFEEKSFLGAAHILMKMLHWPLFLLALAAPVIFALRARQGRLTPADWPLLLPIVCFLYFIGILTVLSWLPRYSVPARPFSYILAAAALCYLTEPRPKPQQPPPT